MNAAGFDVEFQMLSSDENLEFHLKSLYIDPTLAVSLEHILAQLASVHLPEELNDAKVGRIKKAVQNATFDRRNKPRILFTMLSRSQGGDLASTALANKLRVISLQGSRTRNSKPSLDAIRNRMRLIIRECSAWWNPSELTSLAELFSPQLLQRTLNRTSTLKSNQSWPAAYIRITATSGYWR